MPTTPEAESAGAPERTTPLPAWLPESVGGAFGMGLAIAGSLTALRLAILAALGKLDSAVAQDHRVAIIVSLLTGFTIACVAYGNAALQRDLQLWRRELGWSEAEMGRARARHAMGRASASLVVVGFVALSLLLVTQDSGAPILFKPIPYSTNVWWSFAANILLFGWMGYASIFTVESLRLRRELEAQPLRIDLLDLSSVRQLASSGLRASFFWLGGSSLAAPLFVDLNFSWPTAAMILFSVVTGTWLFLMPLMELAARIRAEKLHELTRVRQQIRASRDALLDRAGRGMDAEAVALPALLAWERRVDEISEWAVDLSSVLRFLTLVILALGSWLGGALTDRAVETILR